MPSPWPRAPPGPPTAPPGPCCRPPRPPGHAWGAGPPRARWRRPPAPSQLASPDAHSAAPALCPLTSGRRPRRHPRPQLPPVNWVAPPAPQRPPPEGEPPAASPSDPRASWRGPSPRGRGGEPPPASPGPGPRGPRDRRRHVAAEPLALALRRHAAAHPAVPAVPPARRAKAPRAPSRSVWPVSASLHTHRPRFFAIW
ncbi:hypothetical protein N7454_009041 [Penicillium verhagenii]|nr:hypothetical protein N7454_009041 [Penicillium verhagenii]